MLSSRARAQREFACDVVLGQLLPVLEGQWRPGVAAAPPAPAAEGPPTTFLDVSHSLENGWSAPVGLSRVEQEVGDMLAQRRVPVRLVRRGAEDGGYRRLTARELEFVGNRADEPADETVSVVGCLCTPLDLLGDGVTLPRSDVGDLVVLFQAGAYGLTASPTAFLGHPASLEVLV